MNETSPSLPTIELTEHGRVRLLVSGFVPTTLTETLDAIPGGRRVADGFEWGYSPEVLRRLYAITGRTTQYTGEFLDYLQAASVPPLDQRTPVLPGMETLPWRANTLGLEHQRAFKWWRRGGGLDRRTHQSALLEAGKGTGKTLTSIEEILELLRFRPAAKVLVLARNSNLRTVWHEQISLHSPDLLPFVHILNATRKDRVAKLDFISPLPEPAIFVHSHEDLPAMRKTLLAYDWDMAILDESSRFRSAGAGRVAMLTGNQSKVLAPDHRLALSGGPVIKRATDLYPTLKWLGAPTGNKAEFSERFLMLGGYTGNEELAIKDPEGLNELLAAYRFVIPKGTVFNLPRNWSYEELEMSAWQHASYRRIQKELRTFFTDATGKVQERLVKNRIGELLRLTQVSAGFEAIDVDRYNWHDQNPKTIHLLTEILPEFEGDQVIVWCHFQAEVQNLHRLISKAGRRPVMYYGGQGTMANDEAYEAFRDGQADTLIANTAKAAHGLNLPRALNMVYYSRVIGDTESWEQSLERNARLSTDKGAVLNVVVLCCGPIDAMATKNLGDDLRKASQVTSLDVAYVLGMAA